MKKISFSATTILFALLSSLLFLTGPARAQVNIPQDPNWDTVLQMAKEPGTGNPVMNWTAGPLKMEARRSDNPEFRLGPNTVIFGYYDAPTNILLDTSSPQGLSFYRVIGLDRDWPFWEICDHSNGWDPTVPATVSYDDGTPMYAGPPWTAGDVEAVHFVPECPMVLKTLRLYFGNAAGEVEVHLWGDSGRSEPNESVNLIPAQIFNVPINAGWTTIDISAYDIQVHPKDHFWVGFVHRGPTPYLIMDDGDAIGYSHSMFKDPDRIRPPYQWSVFAREDPPSSGIYYYLNYLVHVDAEKFCELTTPIFTDVSNQSGVETCTNQRVTWGDVDNDRFDDLLLDAQVLLRNQGNGTFADVSAQAGIQGFSQGLAVFGDVDNDGDQDLYLGVYTAQNPLPVPGDPQDRILLNDGTGVFTPVPAPCGVEEFSTTSAAAFGDYDADGCLDIYVGNWLEEYPKIPAMKDFLFKGNCDGTFTDVTDSVGMTDQGGANNSPCYGVAWCDYDNDGDMDIFVGNYGWVANFLWENRGGTFVNVAAAKGVDKDDISTYGGNTFGEDWGDVNNDGNFDLFMTEIAHPRYLPDTDISSLQINSGPPNYTFQNERVQRGIAYDEGDIEASFIDFNNDGRLDLCVSSLYPLHYARLYRQEPDGKFTDVTYLAGINVHDATNHAWADYDRDGDVDLAITNRTTGHHVYLYRNEVGTQNHWVTFRLEGADCNRSGIGARVTLTSAALVQHREVQGGKGHFNSQPSMPVEFGLAQNTTINEVKVRWPCGRVETFTGVAEDGFYLLREGQTAAVRE